MGRLRRLLGRLRGGADLARREAESDRFLTAVHGLIHVGANTGQEREIYARHRLAVLWIEPIPEVFAQLRKNIAAFPQQRAVEALVTDADGERYEFHVANNRGESSSVLALAEHKDVWPKVEYTRTIVLESRTLPSLLARERLDPVDYDALVLDTQGSELLVLRGAEALLEGFRFIKTEVPDFEAYAGCCKLADIEAFLSQRGYREIARRTFATRAAGGCYYDVVYERCPGLE